ncbi:hypothetical protein [Brevibacterium jeotgali]|uniref:hypothetical protein n=1 Tax=Brevibacterium jeotgali TaxID=1262550 RepID=UPI0015E0BA46|nr:hypothetical protein [Brevibacterium jeotgali]
MQPAYAVTGREGGGTEGWVGETEGESSRGRSVTWSAHGLISAFGGIVSGTERKCSAG